MPKFHSTPHISELTESHHGQLRDSLKKSNGKASLIVHHGFWAGETYDEDYLNHLKRVQEFVKNADGPVFYMMPHPELEQYEMDRELHNKALGELSSKGLFVKVYTHPRTPTPIFEDWFQPVLDEFNKTTPEKHRGIDLGKLSHGYESAHSQESWKRLAGILEKIGVKELHLVGEQAHYRNSGKVRISELTPEQIASAIDVAKQNPGENAMLKGCLAKTHQMLLKYAKKMRLVVHEDKVFPGNDQIDNPEWQLRDK